MHPLLKKDDIREICDCVEELFKKQGARKKVLYQPLGIRQQKRYMFTAEGAERCNYTFLLRGRKCIKTALPNSMHDHICFQSS